MSSSLFIQRMRRWGHIHTSEGSISRAIIVAQQVEPQIASSVQSQALWEVVGAMREPLLLIVLGLPCTGKTTLARRLAADLRLPLVAKDGIKETLFGTLGWSDRAWSRRLGMATYALIYHLVEAQLSAGRSLIVESPFDPQHATREFLALKNKYGFRPVQVLCWAEDDVLVQRFTARAASGERHPGHVDHLNAAEFEETLRRGQARPLDIGGPVFEVDTTDWAAVDYAGLLERVRSTLHSSSATLSNGAT